MAEARTTSPWVWVAVGCGGVLVLGIVGVLALGFLGFRAARQLEQDLKDPDARRARALEILGADALPEGLSPALAISVPFVSDIVMLTDRPVSPENSEPEFDEYGLWYFELIAMGRNNDRLRDYFAGRSDDASVLRDSGINVDIDEVLQRGTIDEDDRTLMYLVMRGSVSTQGASHGGMTTLTLIDCPGDARGRFSMWFGPDPDPAASADAVDLSGSTGDRGRIAALHAGFRVCD